MGKGGKESMDAEDLSARLATLNTQDSPQEESFEFVNAADTYDHQQAEPFNFVAAQGAFSRFIPLSSPSSTCTLAHLRGPSSALCPSGGPKCLRSVQLASEA